MFRWPQCAPNLLIEEMGDEVATFIPASGRTVILNTTGGALLELCDGRHTTAEIAEQIVAVLPADLAQVTADVTCSLEEFAGLGLVIEGAGAATEA